MASHPNLDKLLKEGINFENAFVTTLSAVLQERPFNGTYANRHGVVVNEYVDYDKGYPLLPHFYKRQDIKPLTSGNGTRRCTIDHDLVLANGWYSGAKVNILMMLC